MATEAQAPKEQPAPKAQTGLFVHTVHPHEIHNANLIHKAELAAGSMNEKIAVRLTSIFQAMPTFWLVIVWFVLWIGANLTIARFDPIPCPLPLTLASIPQLPLMIVIMVGQGLLGRKQEIQSEEQFNTTQNAYHDIKQVIQHLNAQDAELLKQTHMLVELMKATGAPGYPADVTDGKTGG